MRKTLLEPLIMEAVYYTNAVIRSTLMVGGDCEFEPFLLLADAACAETAATPKELARVLGIDARMLELAGSRWENEGLLVRTRSPIDRRSVGYASTLIGSKHVKTLSELVARECQSFWRCSEEDFAEFARSLGPFQRIKPVVTFPDAQLPIPLRSLCALHSLWSAYQAFSHESTLTFSEMHILLMIERFGPQPNRVLFPAMNQFAQVDYHTLQLLADEKGHLVRSGDVVRLSERGEDKVRELHNRCENPTPGKAMDEIGPAARLARASFALVECATKGSNENYGWATRGGGEI